MLVAEAEIALVVPADPRYLHILRTLTAGVASMLEIPYDTLDDQRIAVAEAANLLLGLAPAATSLTLQLQPRREELRISLEAEADPVSSPSEADLRAGFSWTIIENLADAAELVEADGKHRITMRWTTLHDPPA
jgi:Histidine kinase-like ATPase domain